MKEDCKILSRANVDIYPAVPSPVTVDANELFKVAVLIYPLSPRYPFIPVTVDCKLELKEAVLI